MNRGRSLSQMLISHAFCRRSLSFGDAAAREFRTFWDVCKIPVAVSSVALVLGELVFLGGPNSCATFELRMTKKVLRLLTEIDSPSHAPGSSARRPRDRTDHNGLL
jgi:hypothetical protein